MALQTNLSKKDKMTIAIVLFVALVFVVAWFLIRPSISSITTTEEKIKQAEQTQQLYKQKIISLSSGEAVYEKSVNDLNDSTVEFYQVMDSSEIDKMVTSYVLKSGLFSENLVINILDGSVKESPYTYSSLANTKPANNSSSDSSSDSSKNTNTPTPASGKNTNTQVDSLITPYNKARDNATNTSFSGVQCVKLTLVVTGSQATCQAFIDDICTKPAVRITGFEWQKVDLKEKINEETGEIEYVNSGIVRLKLDLNLYMADIADYNVTAEG